MGVCFECLAEITATVPQTCQVRVRSGMRIVGRPENGRLAKRMFDLAIVGAGPAECARLYGAASGLAVAVLDERNQEGKSESG